MLPNNSQAVTDCQHCVWGQRSAPVGQRSVGTAFSQDTMSVFIASCKLVSSKKKKKILLIRQVQKDFSVFKIKNKTWFLTETWPFQSAQWNPMSLLTWDVHIIWNTWSQLSDVNEAKRLPKKHIKGESLFSFLCRGSSFLNFYLIVLFWAPVLNINIYFYVLSCKPIWKEILQITSIISLKL